MNIYGEVHIHSDGTSLAAHLQRIEGKLDALMTSESTSNARLLALAQQTNDYTNRLGAAAAGIAADLNDLKAAIANGTVTPEALSQLDGAVANLNTMAASLEAIDAGYPVPEPTPTPAPEEPTEVPPVEEAPGSEAPTE